MERVLLVASLLLVLLCGGAVCDETDCDEKDCLKNYIYPNKCGPGREYRKDNKCDSDNCCSLSTCCRTMSRPTCNLSTSSSGCCQYYQSMCTNYQQVYTARRVRDDLFTVSCVNVARDVRTQPSRWTCPTNYFIQTSEDKVSDGDNLYAGFCIPNNCWMVDSSDCTRCRACNPGHSFVSDGSCQPNPTITGTVTGNQVNSLIQSPEVLSLNTDVGFANATISVSFRVSATGSLSWLGGTVSLSFVRCFINRTEILSSTSTGQLTFSRTLPTGTAVLNCTAMDTNNLTVTVSKTIMVVDNEPPLITCSSSTLNTGPQSSVSFVWPTVPAAWDNVRVLGSFCRGGPANNVFQVGVTTITCWAWDTRFNSTCTGLITVIDNWPANISCPASIRVNTTTGLATGRASFVVTAWDNIRLLGPPLCTANNNTLFPVGSTSITCTASDEFNPPAQCSFSVNVSDFEPPRITCPATLNLSLGAEGLTQRGTLIISAVDNTFVSTLTCGAQPVLLSGDSTSASLTGTIVSDFPLGTSSLTCTAADRSGNTRSCDTTVVVRDSTPPVIVCANSELHTLPNANFSLLSSPFFNVVATDNVELFNISCSLPNTTRFPVGTTAVTCTARDRAGNAASCPLSVIVADHQLPTVQCPSSAIAVATNLTNNITVAIPQLNATDNVRVANTSIIVVENQLAATTRVLPGNSTTLVIREQWTAFVTFIAVDSSGNSAACSFGISVFALGEAVDDIPPVIHNCPANSSLSFVPPSDFYSPLLSNTMLYNRTTLRGLRYNTLSWPPLNATDNSGQVAAGYLIWSPNPANALAGLPAGFYVVAYGATDRRGNSAYCAFRVQVLDIEPPSWLRCSGNQLYDSGTNPGSFATLWPQGSMFAIDNVDIPLPEGSCTSVPVGYCPQTPGQPPAIMFPVGTVQFTYTAVDSWGNQAMPCRFNVTVRDTGEPTIPACPVSETTIIASSTLVGNNVVDVSRKCPTLIPADNVPTGVTLSYNSVPPGFNCSSHFPIGVTILIARARDAVGLLSTPCYIVVSITDDESPVISGCPSGVSIVNCSQGLPTAEITLPPISATDNSGAVLIETQPAGYLAGGRYNLTTGLHTITFKASDNSSTGNPSTCDVRFFVNDTQAPIIHNFPRDAGVTSLSEVLSTDPGQPTATYTLPPLYATDNVRVAFAGLDSQSYSPGQTYQFPVGSLRLRYTAQDENFNVASVTMQITVEDHEKPVFIGCPSSDANSTPILRFNTTLGQSTQQVSWNISVQDNSRRRVLTYLESDPVGYSRESFFPVGSTTITQTAVDVSGNTQTCTFIVQVDDREPPTIQCPDNITVTTLLPGDTVAPVVWRTPIAQDNSGQSPLVNSTLSSGNYSLGQYRVVNTAEDPSGNIASCTFFFAVVQARSTDSTSAGASAGAMIAGGAGGGIALIVLLVLLVLLLMRRNYRRKINAAASGYAELMAMSDEFVLERARAIQQALVDQRAAEPPAAVNAQFIHPTRKFAAPPTTLKELEEYIRETVRKELSRDSLEFGPELGAGEFGAVYRGEHSSTDVETGLPTKQTVAIKMLKNSTKDEDKVRFLKEAAIMAQFSHPNIVGLVGVCTLPPTEPTLIVLEYMHLGSLQGYLQSPMVKDQLETLTMLRMALEVGSAMQYLAEAGFVHRDLAARNVLLDENMNCRVGDFGLSVDLAASDEGEGGIYSGDEGAKIPVRWTAIEAICFRQFSTASDVWSFGVLLWEIWSYAELPYKGWNNKRVTEQVIDGYRLPKPSNCPDEVYTVMLDCWNKNVKRRITFHKINARLAQAWKDIAKEALGGDAANGNLYDTGDDDGAQAPSRGSRPGAGNTLYDVGDEQTTTTALSNRASHALYDVGSDGNSNPNAGGVPALYDVGADGGASTQPVTRASLALYDTGDDGGASGAQPAAQASGDAPAHTEEEGAAGLASDPGYLLLNEH